jgi:hypothetical protein
MVGPYIHKLNPIPTTQRVREIITFSCFFFAIYTSPKSVSTKHNRIRTFIQYEGMGDGVIHPHSKPHPYLFEYKRENKEERSFHLFPPHPKSGPKTSIFGVKLGECGEMGWGCVNTPMYQPTTLSLSIQGRNKRKGMTSLISPLS